MGGLVVKPILKMPSTTNFVGLSRFGPTFRATSCLFNVYGNCVKVVCDNHLVYICINDGRLTGRFMAVLYRFVVARFCRFASSRFGLWFYYRNALTTNQLFWRRRRQDVMRLMEGFIEDVKF